MQELFNHKTMICDLILASSVYYIDAIKSPDT